MLAADDSPRGSDRIALAITLTVLALMSAAAIALVNFKGSNVPIWDDWDIVPTMTGHQQVTWHWLWSQHNEHRVPLPRLIMLGLFRCIATDFRVAMYFNVILTSLVALGLLLVLRRERGRSSWFDAFIPIVLLNWGQAANFLWAWQVQFFSSAVLACMVLMLILLPVQRRHVLWVGACAVLLSLCGANGLALVPAIVLWIAYVSMARWGRGAALPLVFAAVALVIVGAYFIGYEPVPFHLSTHDANRMARAVARFLTIGFGPGIGGFNLHLIPQSYWAAACIITTSLLSLTMIMLIWIWWREPTQRLRSGGLICFLGAMLSLAIGLSTGRDAHDTRYATLSVPALCAVYAAWCIFGPRLLRAIMPGLLLAIALIALIPNMRWGLQYARDLRGQLSSFESDMRAGIPPSQLIHRYRLDLHPQDDRLTDYMPLLRSAGIGAFVSLKDDPPFEEIAIPLHIMKPEEPSWVFMLPHDVFVAGVRVRYSFKSDDLIAPFLSIYWRSQQQSKFSPGDANKYSPTGDIDTWRTATWFRHDDQIHTMHAWVYDNLNMVVVMPFKSKGTLTIHDVTLLAPAATTTPVTSPPPARARD